MKPIRLASAFAAALVIAGTTLAQTPAITSFQGNGQLTWTNGDTNLFYRIEWAPSLTAPDTWQSNYCALADIRSSASVVTSSVPMFYRVCGSSNRVVFASPVPKTGQTTSSQVGDDGALQSGVAWPNPRFAVQADTNCVLDNLSGLIWARSANLTGPRTWSAAVTYCDGLTYGGTNDWRLPTVRELQSLVDYERDHPSLPVGHPFTNVQNFDYWSSTTVSQDRPHAFVVGIHYGGVSAFYEKTASMVYVWPVRGGH